MAFSRNNNNNRNDNSKRRRKPADETIDYKNVELLSMYVNSRGKITGRRGTGTTAKRHRAISKAIKRARALGLMPFIMTQRVQRGY